MSGFADIHHHILYGVDDGPDSYEKMTDMLVAAYENGISTIVATPHVTPGVTQPDVDKMLKHYYEACAYCKNSGLPMRLIFGAENLYTPMMVNDLQKKQVITLGDSMLVLVEFSPKLSFREIEQAVVQVCSFGYTPVLAHIERYPGMMLHPLSTVGLKKRCQVLYQVNTSTVVSGFKGIRGGVLNYLFKHGLIDFVSTDAHNTTSRRVRMKEAYHALRDRLGTGAADRMCRTSIW